jgi:protein-S-isoprenylcysteine O-methyltransferase
LILNEALFNPSVTSSDSFLVNHSNAYTGANLFAATEFGFKFIFFPHFFNVWVSRVGIVLLLISQAVRSLAMITCGESFNHLIQTQKKDNHVLITHGIYKYLRHPSYVGFHYWSVGSQLLLNNPISSILFSYASWMFFRRRIPYEERSLMHHFPNEYAAYSRKARIMIPFIPSPIFEHAKST